MKKCSAAARKKQSTKRHFLQLNHAKKKICRLTTRNFFFLTCSLTSCQESFITRTITIEFRATSIHSNSMWRCKQACSHYIITIYQTQFSLKFVIPCSRHLLFTMPYSSFLSSCFGNRFNFVEFILPNTAFLPSNLTGLNFNHSNDAVIQIGQNKFLTYG